MEFTFITRANTFFGDDVVKKNAAQWIIGERAFIITGKHSGRMCGALGDVEKALNLASISYELFEGVENNPSIEQCLELAQRAREKNIDFIVAIGGGSPIDAAKAVSVLIDENVTPEMLFRNEFCKPLPLVAIPTTSGSGSEVTPWSVLTRHSISNKQSFGNILTVPQYALLDPKYTASLSEKVTVDTAIDAMSHSFEGMMSIKANPVSDAFALEGLRYFSLCADKLLKGDYASCRDELMLCSMFGGMTIAHTGTTLIHAMGYPLTYFKGLAHGEANAYIMLAAVELLEKASPAKAKAALNALGMSADELVSYLKKLMPLNITLTEDEIKSYSPPASLSGAAKNTPRPLTAEDIAQVFRTACSRANICQ